MASFFIIFLFPFWKDQIWVNVTNANL